MLILNPASLLFSVTLVLGTILAISAPTWLTSWMGLELNVLSFIPLILSKPNSFSSEAAIKYFLIQAMSSATLIMGVMILLITSAMPMAFMTLSLLLKMGAAPLHFWLPPLMQSLTWMQCLTLMTLQKIAPMALISYTASHTTSQILIMSSVLSALVGGLGGLNQTLMRKIMAYSSINHMAWMLASIYLQSTLWMNYLFVYSAISITLVVLMNSMQIFQIQQMFSINSSQVNKVSMFMGLFSLGGLPPLLGFIPKLMTASAMADQKMITWLFILTMTTLVTLFYYTRISITGLTMMTPKNKSISASPYTKNMALLMINLFPIFLPLTALVQF